MSKWGVVSKRLTAINSFSSVGAMGINSVLAIWLQQFLLKRVSADEYSLIAVLSAIMTFLPLLSTIFTSAIGRYVIEALAKDDEEGVTRIVSTIFPFLIVSSALVASVGALAVRYVDVLVKVAPEQVGNARIMLSMMFVSFVARLLLAPFSIGLYAQQRMLLENSIQLVASAFKAALLVFLLFCVDASVVWVVMATTASELLGLLAVSLVSIRQIPSLRFKPGKFAKPLIRPLLSFGGWNVVGQLGSMIRTAADPLILNRFATSVDVTAFYFGSLPDRLIRSFMSAAMAPIIPQLTTMHAMDQKEGINRAFLRLGRLSLWLIGMALVPLFVFGNELFSLYLQEKFQVYGSSTLVMYLLLAYLPLAYSITGLNSIVVAVARNKAYMIITLASQIMNLALTLVFVAFMRLGATGSALATVVAGTIVTVFLFFPLSLRMTGIRARTFLGQTLLPGLAPGFASAIACIALKAVVHPESWVSLFACIAAGTVAYSLVAFLWCFKDEDRRDARRILDRVTKRRSG